MIEDGLAEESSIARFNGQRGVSLDVRRRSGANTVAVARAVRAELDTLRSELPAGMEVTLARDMAVFIEDSIEAIFIDMLWGCLLVVLVVLLFLRNTRSTLIAGLAIPSSLIASFTFFYLSGFTLNMMTLMALALSIGIVIDDAIVVLEVVYRRIEHGESAMEAAEKGSEQVMLAVLSTTLALCAVFVPIAFLEGSVGQWFYEFGIVMAIAVLVSMLFALTLTPMLASRILSVDQSRGRFFHLLDRGLNALDSFYAAVLRHAMRHRWLTLTAALAGEPGRLRARLDRAVRFLRHARPRRVHGLGQAPGGHAAGGHRQGVASHGRRGEADARDQERVRHGGRGRPAPAPHRVVVHRRGAEGHPPARPSSS